MRKNDLWWKLKIWKNKENCKKKDKLKISKYVRKVHSQTSQLDLRPVIVSQDFETSFHSFDEQAILSDWQKKPLSFQTVT